MKSSLIRPVILVVVGLDNTVAQSNSPVISSINPFSPITNGNEQILTIHMARFTATTLSRNGRSGLLLSI